MYSTNKYYEKHLNTFFHAIGNVSGANWIFRISKNFLKLQTSGEKPLLQRMAEEKRLQMERGSIGGSYFVVQLPDGTMEKRLKVNVVDDSVCSCFH